MKRSTKATLVAGTALAILVPAVAVSADLVTGRGPGGGRGDGNGPGNGTGICTGQGSATMRGPGMGGMRGPGRTVDGATGRTSTGAGAGAGVEIVAAQLDALAPATLSAEEIAGLQYMVEEEQLAHDVYTLLADRWGTPVFDRIASAETAHAELVRLLLDRYDLDDPTVDHVAGQFDDPELQALYDALAEQGTASLVDALRVGATIEDRDIADLRDRASEAPDVALVYDHLERGSRNHLRAFARQLDAAGAEFTPVHLTQAEYDAIVSAGPERGPVG